MNPRTTISRCAVALMLIIGLYSTGTAISQNSALFSLLIYAQTGQVVLPPTQPAEPENSISPTQTTQPTQPSGATDAVISFSPGDLSSVQVNYLCDSRPDLQQLICRPLGWKLRGEEPTVLIVHTHTTEGYCDTYDMENTRTLEESGNMLAIGDEVARVLELGGIRVIHDRTFHDYPDYSGAYAAARQTIQGYLRQYPSICMVLDLHRDAASEGLLRTEATVDGQKSAQMLFVTGSGYAGWEDNLSLALKLTALMEQENPGLTRPVSLRSKRYNLDLTPGSLLVEMGGSGNTKQEAMIAANALARAILTLADGSG